MPEPKGVADLVEGHLLENLHPPGRVGVLVVPSHEMAAALGQDPNDSLHDGSFLAPRRFVVLVLVLVDVAQHGVAVGVVLEGFAAPEQDVSVVGADDQFAGCRLFLVVFGVLFGDHDQFRFWFVVDRVVVVVVVVVVATAAKHGPAMGSRISKHVDVRANEEMGRHAGDAERGRTCAG